ncbi:hypothetical protein BH23CHL2_BH23CHL2_25220 [soil metagenome]
MLVLEEYGPVMDRGSLEEHCIDMGIERSTFYVYLGYSPIIAKYARGVYGIRGAETDPSIIESLIPVRNAKQVLLDYGWTKDGDIWIVFRLTDAAIGSGVVGIPSAMKSFIQGEFLLVSSDDADLGTLVIKDTSAWGLGPLFRRRGGEQGDILLLSISLENRRVFAQIGSDELIDDLHES